MHATLADGNGRTTCVVIGTDPNGDEGWMLVEITVPDDFVLHDDENRHKLTAAWAVEQEGWEPIMVADEASMLYRALSQATDGIDLEAPLIEGWNTDPYAVMVGRVALNASNSLAVLDDQGILGTLMLLRTCLDKLEATLPVRQDNNPHV